MKPNKAVFREVNIVRFFEPGIMSWNPRRFPVVVREVGSQEMFTLYESQLKRIPSGKDDKGQDRAIWGYVNSGDRS